MQLDITQLRTQETAVRRFPIFAQASLPRCASEVEGPDQLQQRRQHFRQHHFLFRATIRKCMPVGGRKPHIAAGSKAALEELPQQPDLDTATAKDIPRLRQRRWLASRPELGSSRAAALPELPRCRARRCSLHWRPLGASFCRRGSITSCP